MFDHRKRGWKTFGEVFFRKSHSESEPPPAQDLINETIVIEMVRKDLDERAEFGKRKYRTYLQTNNGRRSLVDAYQEALDLCMYLKQRILEEEQNNA